MVTWRRLSVILAVAALGMSLSASTSSPIPSASSSTTTTKTVPGSIPMNVPNQDAVRRDVHTIDGATAQDGCSAGGTIRSTLGHEATYIITVFFTSTQATNLADGGTAVPVRRSLVRRRDLRRTGAALCVLRVSPAESFIRGNAGHSPALQSDESV